MRRNPRIARVLTGLTGIVLSTALLGACSSDSKSASTDAATEAAAVTEAPATEAPATEAVETAAPETAAPATEAAASEAAATEAAGSASSEAAAPAGIADTLVTQILMGMNNGATPDPVDVKCVTGQVKEEDLSALMASGGGNPSPGPLKNVMKAVFGCRPKGLSESFTTQVFDDIPADVTAEQKTCMGNEFLDILAKDDAVLDAVLADLNQPPKEIKEKFRPLVNKCLPAGASRDAVLKKLDES